jgi:hypothetical protein
MHDDALALANRMDDLWHDQTRSFEREAVALFWGLLTLTARVLDPQRPREMLLAATVLRNARFKGDAVKGMFFANKDFTEVDALFFSVGSTLGHTGCVDAMVEARGRGVERVGARREGVAGRAAQQPQRPMALRGPVAEGRGSSAGDRTVQDGGIWQ